MKSHYSEALDRDTVAREVALSPAYYSSLFKRHTDYSPIQYLKRLRLDRAKLLLRQTDFGNAVASAATERCCAALGTAGNSTCCGQAPGRRERKVGFLIYISDVGSG
ncbi:AraC-like DNA-binding protein [Paenibacillus sacheonensis]|nr:AraC-like DNA-binding protein [Paenibacillus sacheonensis]